MILDQKIRLKRYNTGIIIQARTGSKRFPKKILYKIDEKNILEIMIERLLVYFNNEDIFIATTKESKDNVIVKIAQKLGVNIFRGSENNVINRFIKCAEKNNLKKIIRLTSDCPLIDPELILRLFKRQLNKKLDYSGNCFPYSKRTFPVGSDIEFINLNLLKKIYKEKLNNYKKEHVTPFLLKKKFKTYIFRTKIDNSNLRYTLDYKEDLVVIKKIINYLKNKNFFGSTNEIIKFLKNNKKIIQYNSKHVHSYYIKKLNQL